MLITRNAFKLFYNALVQKMKDFKGNWNQNDPTAHDYIKNRPFYNEKLLEINWDGIVNSEFFTATIGEDFLLHYYKVSDQFYSSTEFIGAVVDVSGVEENGLSSVLAPSFYITSDMTTTRSDGVVVVQNGLALVISAPSAVTNDSYSIPSAGTYILHAKAEDISVILGVSASSNIYASKIVKENIVKIDKKYLPDLPDMDYVSYEKWQDLTEDQMLMARENIGAGTSDFSGDYRDLKNQPTIYQYVVRYDATQSLTDDDKSKARNNIDAISRDEALSVTIEQTLTDRQKKLARDNIGASDFDGSFESLTDAPNVMTLDTEQNVPNRKVLNFGQDQSVDGTMTGLEINTCMWKDTDGEMNYHTLLGNGTIKMSRTYADGTSQEMMLSPGIIATGMDTIQFQRHHALSGQSVRIVNLLSPVDYHDAATKGYVDDIVGDIDTMELITVADIDNICGQDIQYVNISEGAF